MNRSRVMLLAILCVCVFEAYRYRVLIQTRLWHLRHGETLVVDHFVVPVPRNWYVKDTGDDSRLLIRLDTEDRSGDPSRDQKGRFHAFVSIDFSKTLFTMEKLERWTTIQTSMVKKEGSEPDVRTFNLDGETISCVGGQRFSQFAAKTPQFFESDPNSGGCMSSGQLQVQFAGADADMPQVWNIVSHIRKRS